MELQPGIRSLRHPRCPRIFVIPGHRLAVPAEIGRAGARNTEEPEYAMQTAGPEFQGPARVLPHGTVWPSTFHHGPASAVRSHLHKKEGAIKTGPVKKVLVAGSIPSEISRTKT